MWTKHRIGGHLESCAIKKFKVVGRFQTTEWNFDTLEP